MSFNSWNWSYICATGLTPWQPKNRFLAPCFQEICLQLPMLMAFAITSAYFFGNQTVLVRRNKSQHFFISLRILTAFLLISLNIYQMFELIVKRIQIWPIDILICGFQIVTWFIHIGKSHYSIKLNLIAT